jgi:hypothetical protein
VNRQVGPDSRLRPRLPSAKTAKLTVQLGDFLHCALQEAPIQSRFWGENWLTINEETRVALTCPSCGNDQNFLVKTLQMHVLHLDDSRVEVSEEGRPAVLEILCDECEQALNFDDVDEGLRKEVLLTLGAR